MANDSIIPLRDFYNTITRQGLRTQHQFQISIGRDELSDMIVYASSAALPGRKIEAQGAKFYGFEFQVPVNTTYTQEWKLSFRCDTGMKIRKIFEDWMNEISDLDLNTGGSKGIVPDTDATFMLLDETLTNSIRTYKMVGMYPMDLSDITHSHDNSELSTFDVTMKFQYWYPEDQKDPLG